LQVLDAAGQPLMARRKKKSKPKSGSHGEKKPSSEPEFKLGDDGLPVLDEEGNPIRVVKPKKKSSSSHKAKKPEGGSAAAGGDSLPGSSSKGNGHKGGSGSGSKGNGSGSGSGSKGKSSSKSGDSAVQSGGSSKKGGAGGKSNQSPGGASKASAVGAAPKSKKRKHGSVDGAAAPKAAAASSTPSPKKKKKKKAEDVAPVLEFDDDDALYADAGMTRLCDGSVFFGVFPRGKGLQSGGGDVRGVGVVAVKMESDAAASCSDLAVDVAADMSTLGVEKTHIDASNCNELETSEVDLLNGPSRANAFSDNDAYCADENARASDKGSCAEDSADAATNEMRDGNVAAASEGGEANSAQSAVADQLAGEMEDGHNHNSADQNTVVSGDKSEPTSTPACHPSPRLLRPTRAPSSSHTSTAPSSKLNRLHADSPNTSQKPGPGQAEQDTLFIRSATAPPIECFNPVFHFQR
jgi:hypothetical protein